MKQQTQSLQILHSLQGITFSASLAKILLQKFNIYSRMIGITSSNKNNAKVWDPPFMIEDYAVAYLMKEINQPSQIKINIKINVEDQQKINKLRDSFEYKVYQKLIKSGYIPISGHKFGCTFLAYQQDPDASHSKYLVFVSKNVNLNEMTRLAQSCKKQALYASQINQQIKFYVIERLQEEKQNRKRYKKHNEEDNEN